MQAEDVGEGGTKMTEEQASDKWCPMVRLFTRDGLAGNKCEDEAGAIREDGAQSCVGSACMMWRWEKYFLDDGKKVLAMTSDANGYCGLAGKP